MNNWLLRGVVFAAAMVVVRLVQGILIKVFPTQAGWIIVVALVPFVIAALLWGLRDGRADATANPDPERRADLPMTWLVAGLVAGLLGGAVAWVIGMFYADIHTGGPIEELTTFASFTALLVFVTAMVAVAGGRWLVDREREKNPVRHHGLAAAHEGVDTDVFAAVSEDDLAAAGAGVSDEATTAVVATVPKTERTEPNVRRWWRRGQPAPVDVEQTRPAPLPESDQG